MSEFTRQPIAIKNKLVLNGGTKKRKPPSVIQVHYDRPHTKISTKILQMDNVISLKSDNYIKYHLGKDLQNKIIFLEKIKKWLLI